jgi:hypothetical protein
VGQASNTPHHGWFSLYGNCRYFVDHLQDHLAKILIGAIMPVTVKFIRYGELFDSAELDAGYVELEYIPPDFEEPPPENEVEPWNWGDTKLEPVELAALLALYYVFLER